MKLFQREPTLWLAAIGSVVMIVGTFGLKFISGEQAALIVVVINAIFAAINAYTVRPISPVAFTYAIGSIVTLASSYGLNLPIETVAALNAAVIPFLALLSRGQVTPEETSISHTTRSEGGTVSAP
jgi:membrane-bound ClpP family serine protease